MTRTGRRLAGLAHRALGWCLFHLGANRGARSSYEAVLRLRGEDFRAHVRLAQIAYRFGDYASWQRECAEARRIDPIRFAELGHPFELYDGRSHADRTTRPDRGHEVSRPSLGRAASGDSAGFADLESRSMGVVGLRGDDCSTEEERQRFERLGPIRAEQLSGVDVDELLRRFEA